MGKKLDFALGVLNGAIGDYLVETGNGLATGMECIHDGAPLSVEREVLRNAHPAATSTMCVLVHGLMCTETVWELPEGGDYGAHLARDLGYSPIYLRYNSGRAIADNGAALDELLAALVREWPVPVTEIVLLGFSMGGLVIRSACHVASLDGHEWLGLVRRALYVGTPHLGAPLERVGRVVSRFLGRVDDPYTRLLSQLADMRSAGVKDLGDADLRHDDRARWQASMALRDPRHPVPLLPQIRHYLVAGSLSLEPRLATLFGDVMVPVPSATDGHVLDKASLALPPDHVKIMPGMAHMTLAHHPAVYEQIRSFCQES